MPVRIKNYLLPFLALLTSFALGGASCHHEAPKETSAVEKIDGSTLRLSKEALRNIKVTVAQEGEFPDALAVSGRISVPEDRTVVVPARVSGRVDGLFVASGEGVKKGQVLANLFSSDYAVAREEYFQALHQKDRGLANDEHGLASLAIKKLQSLGLTEADIEKLSPSGTGSPAVFSVRAPRSGVLLDKKIVVGNFVNVGDTLFTVGDIGKVWFAGDIYPEDLDKIHKDQEVWIDVGVGAKPIVGKVSFISPIVDPTSRTIKIRALIDNQGERLRADMYVKGNLILQKRSALLIPNRAVLRLQDESFVYRRVEENTFQRVLVKTSGEHDDVTAVASGLKPSDQIVSEGALLLEAALTSSDAKDEKR